MPLRAEMRRSAEWLLRAALVAALGLALWRETRPLVISGSTRITVANTVDREITRALVVDGPSDALFLRRREWVERVIPGLRLAIVFLVIALIAGLFNFVGLEAAALQGARILFFVFVVLAVLFLLGNVLRGAPRDIV